MNLKSIPENAPYEQTAPSYGDQKTLSQDHSEEITRLTIRTEQRITHVTLSPQKLSTQNMLPAQQASCIQQKWRTAFQTIHKLTISLRTPAQSRQLDLQQQLQNVIQSLK